ncbi:MAG: hypothetical protein ACQERN_08790 [Thermodesulfobacteriota bacterium]
MADTDFNRDIYICSCCGAVSIAPSRTCPQCGADERTGWTKSARVGSARRRTIRRVAKSGRMVVRRYWRTAVAGITAAAFLSLLLPGGGYPAAIGGVLALSAVVYGLYRIFSSRRPGNQKRLYRRLLKLARGDRDLVERMIENERRRSPAAGREELMQDAIYRWERDL